MAGLVSPNLSIMIKAAEKAAKGLVRDFGEVEQLQISTKGPGDFVSRADKNSEKVIFEELQKARPDWSFLMEESGAVEGKDKDFTWIIDPLDGTTNFLHGIPHWCISIGLKYKNDIIAGVIFDPVKDEMFTAEKGGGAFLRRKRLRVSGRNDLGFAAIVTGSPRRSVAKQEQFIREYKAVQNFVPGMRRFGAAALDMAYVAAGRFDAFWERDLKAWDIAAGMVILKEAGGFYCDPDSDKNDVLQTGNIIASNQGLYESFKKVLKAA